MIEVDHIKKEVTLLGDELPVDNWKIIFDKEKNNQSIYNTFMDAINFSKRAKWGDNLIKEIKSSKKEETTQKTAELL